ncbi:tetratricopeptide repeat-containing sensor histidine kinase [Mucilaginibacter daejeonensis]|uniref:tetratricopeptide repeat-containing sensor histidine kinase n=1 Tax=Mucilaginibacter daejeonensis TaxID=398049 RepID=UPI001D170DCB|nr:tetratricopeptide repeat-containing sensor histidine kinase [Mucilaginibacter daejeonensis]UEG54928.1 tetratricopeptide repeat-containing sensor histidine kinase [Mucilaginibacter daejeonensis]
MALPVNQGGGADTLNTLNITDYEKLVKQYRYYKPDSAIYFANMGIDHARRMHDGKGIAMMLNQLGMIDDNRGDFDASQPKYMEALSIYKRIGDAKGQAAVIIRLGVVELRKGNYDKAIAYFLQSLKVSERSNNTAGRMEAYLTVAEGYIGQKKFDVALKYLTIAEKINNTIPFSNLSLNIYNNFGVVYRELGLNDKAKAYLQKGIARSDEPQYQGLNITLINNLAKVYNKEGNKARSIELQRSALAKARKIQNYLRELQTLTGLADTYGAANSKEALFYFNEALQLVREKGARKQQLEILGRMSELYKHDRNFEVALKLKEEQNALADSFFYKAMSKQVVSLQAEYQLYRSRAKVRELKQQNSSQIWQRNFYIGLSGASVFTIFVIAFYFFRTRKLNKLLNVANTDLIESNLVKDKLFSVLAHDLRAPFASVIDLMYLLEDDDVEPEERKALMKKLTTASNVTLETLNMLLKWGEMQIKGVKLNTMIFQPKPAVARVLGLIASNAEKKHVRVKDLVDPTHTIMVDSNHFEFVARNLLSNALKFTPSGGSIQISSRVNEVSGEVIFSVKDSGVGIKAERLARIFDIGNASTKGTNNETGTSLGLVICKEFIELNKGRIWVESIIKQGSTFHFSLPLFKVTTPTPPIIIPTERTTGEAHT